MSMSWSINPKIWWTSSRHVLSQQAHLIDAHSHEGLVAAILQIQPEVAGAALEDLSNVVHLDVEDLDVHLVERNGPQNLKNEISN